MDPKLNIRHSTLYIHPLYFMLQTYLLYIHVFQHLFILYPHFIL